MQMYNNHKKDKTYMYLHLRTPERQMYLSRAKAGQKLHLTLSSLFHYFTICLWYKISHQNFLTVNISEVLQILF